MFHGSYPNTPGLVTAPVGPPFLLHAFFSLSASPGGPPTHTAAAANNQSSPPYLSSELQPWMVVLHEPEKPPFFTFFNFTLSPDLCFFLGLNLFDGGLCSHCCSTGSAAGSGKWLSRAQRWCRTNWTCHISSLVSFRTVGHGGSVRRSKQAKLSGKRKQKLCCFVCLLPSWMFGRLFPLKVWVSKIQSLSHCKLGWLNWSFFLQSYFTLHHDSILPRMFLFTVHEFHLLLKFVFFPGTGTDKCSGGKHY